MDDDIRVHRALADGSRVRLLGMLRGADAPLSAAELAAAVGLHPTTVRGHLEVLLEAGLATSAPEPRRTPGRPRLLYRAADDPARDAGWGGYRLLARILASHLAGAAGATAAEQAVDAGRRWGRYLVEPPPPYQRPSGERARDQAVGLLDDLGFDPELAAGGEQIRLRRCPFLDAAREQPEVVCSLHLGLLRGALEGLDGPVRATELIPFAEPATCIAHLADE